MVAKDGVEALDLIFGSGRHDQGGDLDRPQVVLLDINLPKMSGLDVLKALWADDRTRLLPVVMFITSREEQAVAESYASGANSYVRKPVAFAEFAQALRDLGLYWLLYNQAPPRSHLDSRTASVNLFHATQAGRRGMGRCEPRGHQPGPAL